MKCPIYKLLLASALLVGAASSCRQQVSDIEGMAEKGFYAASRQIYFHLVRENTTLSSYAYGSATWTPSGITVVSGELTADSTQVRVDVPVRMAGPLSSSPLAIKVKVGAPVDYSNSTQSAPEVAVSGTDFTALADSYSLPADSVAMTIPVYFNRSAIRTAGESGKEVILELEAADGYQLRFADATRYRIRVTDALEEPGWWISYSNVAGAMGILGDYTNDKYRYLLAKVPSLTQYKGSRLNEAIRPAVILQVATAALEIAQEHPELGLSESQIRVFLP